MIPGLVYCPNYISQNREAFLTANIDASGWDCSMRRRVQHYGYIYNYKARTIDSSKRIGELPLWSVDIAAKLFKDGYMEEQPDQLIVNEYLPGQGISSHTDCEPCFGSIIASLSLGSPCIMVFTHVTTKVKAELVLMPQSLLVISGQARYKWQHGISARRSDFINGQKLERTRRLSLTFRNVLLQNS